MINKNIKFTIIFFLIIVAAILFRLINLDKYDTWNDEKLSISEANGFLNIDLKEGEYFTLSALQQHNNLTNVIESTIIGDGGNGIFYITMLHYWCILVGNSDYATRLLSVIIGVLVIIMAFYFTNELFVNKKISLFTIILLSFHVQLISYSQEVRAYMLGVLFSLAASYVLIKLIKNNFSDFGFLILYGFIAGTGFLTHYSIIYIYAAHIFALLFIYKIDLKKWGNFSISLSISLIIVLLWLFPFGLEGLRVIGERNYNYQLLSYADPDNILHMRTSFYRIIAGWAQNIIIFSGNQLTSYGFRIIQVVGLLIIPFFILYWGLKNTSDKNRNSISLLFVLCISPLIYATVLSIISKHIIAFQVNYSIFSTPYFIALFGFSLYYYINVFKNNKIAILIPFLQLALMVVSTLFIYLGYTKHAKSKNNYQEISNNINNLINTNKEFIILYNTKAVAMEINKYLNEDLAHVNQIILESEKRPEISVLFTEDKKEIILMD
jgi:uncharacterized membrane protein